MNRASQQVIRRTTTPTIKRRVRKTADKPHRCSVRLSGRLSNQVDRLLASEGVGFSQLICSLIRNKLDHNQTIAAELPDQASLDHLNALASRSGGNRDRLAGARHRQPIG